MEPHPPKNALKFLRWFCREDYLEEIEGDLTEVYEKHYEESPPKAKRMFTLTVIRYFRPGFIKSFKKGFQQNTTAMIRHNFLLTFRTFKRYKTAFLINLIGLSSGLASALLIYLWVNDELNVDKFYANDSRLFQVMEHFEQAYGIWATPSTSGTIAAAFAEEMPEVEYAAVTGILQKSINLSVGENNIRADGHYVSDDFFKVFSHEIIMGNKARALPHKNAIAISEELALKLFNTAENILGKAVEIQHDQQFFISAVFKTTPANSSERFDFVLPYQLYEEMFPSVLKWGNTGNHVYLLMKTGTDIDAFNKKIANYIKLKTGNRVTFRTPFIKRFSEKYLFGRYENGVLAGGRIEYVRLFSAIAIFILIIACINFMNLSTAKASRRTKAVGIKKSLGAGRESLIFQYLSESLALTSLSLVLGVTITFLFLPSFNGITGKHLQLVFDTRLVLSVLTITVLTGLISGSYPAFYLSGFKPVSILKGKLNSLAGELLARRGLVIFQFAISVILIISVLVVFRQIEFIQTKNLGYDRDNILWFKREGKLLENEFLETFLSEIRNQPGVVNASSIRHNLTGHFWGMGGLKWEGKDPDDQTEIEVVAVNYDMVETLGMEIISGRSFSREYNADWQNLIFNEAAIDYMGFEDPIGKKVHWGFQDREIIGVVKNFHFESLHENIKPVAILLWNSRTDRLMVKVQAGREQETISRLQQLYEKLNPGFAFDYRFLDQDYHAQYVAEQRVSTLSRYFAALAILISCLGLFGLAVFTAERRLKEIGIRKIMGSSEFGIVRLLSGEFTKMVLIAIAIALPTGYFAMEKWLEGFAYSIDLELWFFVGAGFTALLIAWLTVGLQTIKAARVNPVECLKDE